MIKGDVAMTFDKENNCFVVQLKGLHMQFHRITVTVKI